jgi:hypothetical protein
MPFKLLYAAVSGSIVAGTVTGAALSHVKGRCYAWVAIPIVLASQLLVVVPVVAPLRCSHSHNQHATAPLAHAATAGLGHRCN